MLSSAKKRKWLVLLAVSNGSFMAALDSSVINTILPVIKNAYQSEIASIEWVVTIYLLVISCLLLTFGRLGDLYGHKHLYVLGFGIFVISSVLCGASTTPTALIIFRGLQAVGGAMLASNAPAILTHNFPSENRGRAIGLNSMMTYLGLTTGPSLGGWLAETLGWRSVFYVNIPVGLLALTLSLVFIPTEKPRSEATRFDLAGAALFLVGLVMLLLALNKGAEWGWSSIPIVALILTALLILLVFILVELRLPEPMLDLSLFHSPLFSAAAGGALLNYICIYSLTFLLPFYLIQGRGMNPAQAGLILSIQPVLMAVTAPISGALSDRIGARWPGMVGMALVGTGLMILAQLGPSSPFWYVILGLAVAGAGTGIFISPNTSALLGAAPPHRQGIASGVQATARNLGMVLGIGLAGAILTTRLVEHSDNALFHGINDGFLVAAFLSMIGIAVSAIKKQ